MTRSWHLLEGVTTFITELRGLWIQGFAVLTANFNHFHWTLSLVPGESVVFSRMHTMRLECVIGPRLNQVFLWETGYPVLPNPMIPLT